MDGSASIGQEDFNKIKNWTSNLISTFDIGRSATRVGIILYSDKPKLVIALDNFFHKPELINAVKVRVKGQGHY